jgi:thioredoxin 1
MSNVAATTDQTFKDDVLKSDLPVIVDFWAAWCGPCRMLAPTIDQISSELSGKIKVFKMDVDSNQATPASFGIQGIPTVIFFSGGKMVSQVVGLRSKPDMLQEIERVFGVRA